MEYKISHCLMTHEKGTKQYSVYRFERDDGYGVLVKNWGKVGTVGQFKSEQGPLDSIWKRYGSTIVSKRSRGYRVNDSGSELSSTREELDEFIKEMELQLSTQAWSMLFGSESTGTDADRMNDIRRHKEMIAVEAIKKEAARRSETEWGTW